MKSRDISVSGKKGEEKEGLEIEKYKMRKNNFECKNIKDRSNQRP